ncbi:MAG TPA: ABC transporter permease [Rugosimonospora sp.]|jgi:simple sugar transport system permease protein
MSEPGGGSSPDKDAAGEAELTRDQNRTDAPGVPAPGAPAGREATEPAGATGPAGEAGQTGEAGPAGEAEPPAGEAGSPTQRFGRTVLDSVLSANTVTVTVLAIFIALVVGAVLIVVSDSDLTSEYGYFFGAPLSVLGDSWTVVAGAYANLFKGAVFDPATVSGAISGTNSWSLAFAPLSETLTYTAPLVFTGLAVALAFRGGLFNIGAQGQTILGAIGGAVIGFDLHLPYGLHLVVALLGAALGGALWAFIAGVLKARSGAHEVIVTIMLNNVAILFLGWVIVQKGVHDPTRTDAISKNVDKTARLPTIPGVDHSVVRVHLGILLGVLAALGLAWLLQRSTVGFRLRAVGSNPSAARTAGMSVGGAYVLVMVLSGALAGLGGGMQVLGTTASSLTGQVTGTIGSDGITVALLGRGKPWGVVASALLFGALHAGGNRMQSYSHVAIDLVVVVQAVIVIFIAAPALVKAIFRLRAARSGGTPTTLAKGW